MTDSIQSKGFRDNSHYNVLFMHSGDNWIRGSENVLLNILARIDRKVVTPYLLSPVEWKLLLEVLYVNNFKRFYFFRCN